MKDVVRRQFLEGVAITGGLGLLSLPRAAFAQAAVSLPNYRRPNDPPNNDNYALKRAFEDSRTVYLPAGGGSGPNGDYYIGLHPQDTSRPTGQSLGNVPDGATIYGDGSFRTIVR